MIAERFYWFPGRSFTVFPGRRLTVRSDHDPWSDRWQAAGGAAPAIVWTA
jgi:hypothetical protein